VGGVGCRPSPLHALSQVRTSVMVRPTSYQGVRIRLAHDHNPKFGREHGKDNANINIMTTDTCYSSEDTW
jgi:hypothetical protein